MANKIRILMTNGYEYIFTVDDNDLSAVNQLLDERGVLISEVDGSVTQRINLQHYSVAYSTDTDDKPSESRRKFKRRGAV